MSHAGLGPTSASGPRRGRSAFAVALLVTAAACVLGAPAGAATVPRSQPLVTLLHDHVARTAPDVHAHRIETVSDRRPLTDVKTVLPVLGHATGNDGRPWVRVALPGRPNGSEGWMPAGQTTASFTGWRISVALSARLVTVSHFGRAVRRFRAVVGAPATPTPRGRFFVEEALALRPRDSGAPFALASSARSNVLQDFDGGPGQIALHGTGNLAGALGTASSHGCLRLDTAAITWMAERIGAGVPLTIVE